MADNKMYVGGLSFDTTKETLEAHFAQFGEITDCIVMMDKTTNRSRGFGFVTYRDVSALERAVGSSHTVDGRDVSCKKATPEGSEPKQDSGGGVGLYNVVKVFVGGLPASCDYDKLTGYFRQFGDIKDAVVMMDNATQRHRGFGYVTFHDSTSVEAAISNYSDNKIDGKWVEVKRCIPQDQMRNAPGGGGGGGRGRGRDRSPTRDNGLGQQAPPGGCGYGCPYGGYGAYGYPAYGGYYGMYPGMPPAYGAYGAYGAPPGAPPTGYGAPPAAYGGGAPPSYPDPYGAAGGYGAAAAGYGDQFRPRPY